MLTVKIFQKKTLICSSIWHIEKNFSNFSYFIRKLNLFLYIYFHLHITFHFYARIYGNIRKYTENSRNTQCTEEIWKIRKNKINLWKIWKNSRKTKILIFQIYLNEFMFRKQSVSTIYNFLYFCWEIFT